MHTGVCVCARALRSYGMIMLELLKSREGRPNVFETRISKLSKTLSIETGICQLVICGCSLGCSL